jgi:hypothetical protein
MAVVPDLGGPLLAFGKFILNSLDSFAPVLENFCNFKAEFYEIEKEMQPRPLLPDQRRADCTWKM